MSTTTPDNMDVVSWALSGTYDQNRPVLIDAERPSRSLSKNRVTEIITSLAGAFEPGSTVCLHLPNDILYPALVLAILASNCCWTGTNPAYTSVELEHHLNTSQTSCIITSEDYLDTVHAAVKAGTRNIEIVLFSDIVSEKTNTSARKKHHGCSQCHHRELHDLLQNFDGTPLKTRLSNLATDSIAAIMSTSGTTGLPKMMQRTHRALILESRAAQDANYLKPYFVRRLYCTPMFHAFSFPEMVINTLRLGFPSFYMRRFDDSFARKTSKYAITETMAAPPILLRLADQASTDSVVANQLQSLQMVLCAGASLSAELRARFLRVFRRPARVVQVWGMSEGGWFATFKYPEEDTTGSVGRAIAGYQVRSSCNGAPTVGQNNKKVSELLVRAPQMTCGYMGNIEATAEAFDKDGWLWTGDIGYVENGKIYLVDRAKDMIKVNGWSVSPAELEAALLQNSNILDAAVVGVGKGTEEHPAAFVIPKTDANMSSVAVTTHLLKFVARHKVARCEVRFVHAIPRNPSGKILRKHLRQQVEPETVAAY